MPQIVVGVETKGFDELNRLMDILPQGPVKQAGKKSLNKAATPVVKAAKQNGARINHEQSGLLRISGSNSFVRVTSRNGHRIVAIYRPLGETVKKKAGISRKTGAPFVVIGPESGTAPHASLVESDTAPHAIAMPNGTVVNHPGTRGQPFLEDAFRKTSAQAQAIFAREMPIDLGKEIVKVARRVGAL